VGRAVCHCDYVTEEKYVPWIDNFGLFNGVGLACTLVGVSVSKFLVDRVGKVVAFRSCLFISAIFMALFSIVPAESMTTMLALQMALQLSFGPTIPILWAMMADVADHTEWLTGRRSTALAFASIIFGLKLGFGIGGWFTGKALEFYNYSSAQTQAPSAVHGIVLMVSVFPAAALLAAAAVSSVYPLNEKLTTQVEEALQQRRKTEQVLDIVPNSR
jgi:Na+/melibiose symporter-like transporter